MEGLYRLSYNREDREGVAMRSWEMLILAAGLSLDVLAVSLCNGALLLRPKKRHMLGTTGVFCGVQFLALLLGRLAAIMTVTDWHGNEWFRGWKTLTVVIIFLLAAHMLVRGVRHKDIFEHCVEKISYKVIAVQALITSVDALLLAFGCHIFGAQLAIFIMLCPIITAVAVVAGTYMGYLTGYEGKNKAYFLGGALFIAGGLELIFRYLV